MITFHQIILLLRYWDALVHVMWPRFQLILEMNTQSIRAVDPSKLGHIDVRPHYVSNMNRQIHKITRK